MQARRTAGDLTEIVLPEPSPSADDEVMHWPSHMGKGGTRLCALDEGLLLGITQGSLHRPTRIAAEQPSCLVNLCFVVDGEIGAEPEAPLPALRGGAGVAFAWLLPQTTSTTELSQCHRLAAIDLSVSREFVQGWAETWQLSLPDAWRRAVEGRDVPLIETGGMPPSALGHARQLIGQAGVTPLQRLRRESMALELLSEYLFARVEAQRRTPAGRQLAPIELERALAAASRLAGRLEDPPGINEIAREVGLSGSRLKLAFRQLFGCGVYGYVKALRLEAARCALIEGQQVKSAALTVGYTKAGHFARQFRDRFGIAPGRYGA